MSPTDPPAMAGGPPARPVRSYTSRLLSESLLTWNAETPWRLRHLVGNLRGASRADRFWAEHLRTITRYASRQALLEACVRKAPQSGLVLEFGVFRGESLNAIADSALGRPDPRVFGFDSFEGLPEDWRPGIRRGAFRLSGPPAVRANATLVVGYFQKTLGEFLDAHRGIAAFVHVDSDLYSSATFVLRSLHERGRLVAGTIVLFDEYLGQENWWRDGEFRAFQELVQQYTPSYRYFGYVGGGSQVAVEFG